jgi:hypothetical protein
MTDLSTTVDTHLAAYGEPDAAKRRPLIEQVWTREGELLDPPFEGRGHDEISAMADVVQQHYAGHSFRRTSGIDEHHGFARYGWELAAPDGAVAVAGVDVAQLDEDGRIVRITGFFGELPDREV